MDDSKNGNQPPPIDPLEVVTEEALAILERRGFDVRGKTVAEIREIIKRPPTKPKSDT